MLQVHTLDRVFQCPQCEKGFKEQRTLRLHLKIHNAEYPEQCSVCQKVFRTKWQLKQHQMDHGGERPYPCPECSFTCKTKQQLNEHRRKHSVSTSYYFRMPTKYVVGNRHHHQFTSIRVRIRRNFLSSIKVI